MRALWAAGDVAALACNTYYLCCELITKLFVMSSFLTTVTKLIGSHN